MIPWCKLNDEDLEAVIGGTDGVLERCMNELYSWLGDHPNATKLDIYDQFSFLIYDRWAEMTESEHMQAQQLLEALSA